MVTEAVFSIIMATPGAAVGITFRWIDGRNGNAIGNASFVLVGKRLLPSGNLIDHYHNQVG
jgi:hypothetical protein